MARVNLRAAFMSGLDSLVAAQEVFADRLDETMSFQRAVENLQERLDQAPISPVIDRTQGRRNVLVFYGVGGIGKTTLSHELERRLLAAAVEDRRSEVVSVRVDLAEDGATDIEGLVLRLRAGLGKLGAHWPAFDLALSCYWARAHPGETLQEFLDSSPMVRRAAKAVGLGDQITAALSMVNPVEFGGLPGLAHRAGLTVFRSVRDRVREGRLLSDCDLFAELIEADADHEMVSYLPYLLAWDLERLAVRRGRRPVVCVFLDTFEVVADRHDETAERLIQRCIYLMPNVLFVVTGRNRVDWADGARGELDFLGKQRWPNLHFSNHVDEPRQHLVGYLSESDADSYLRAALTEGDEPVIGEPVRRRIIDGGQGLPLYLDLSVSHYVELLARGERPGPDDFGGSFTAVATRSIRDLPGEERDLVRTAALVDRFDAKLLHAGQPHLPDGRVVRFLQRPFLMHDDSYDLVYSLHLALRAAINDADSSMPDGWSDQDREEVASRLLDGLGGRIAESSDRATTAQGLEAGLKLAKAWDVFDDWLVDATERLVEAGQWNTVAGWFETDDGDVLPNLAALGAAVEGVTLRRRGDATQAVAVLREAGNLAEPRSKVDDLIRVHLAHALRNTGDYTEAARIYRELQGRDFDTVARYWLCDHDYLNGRFVDALANVESWQSRDSADEGERLRLVGHIARVNARFEQATNAYEAAIELARNEGLAAAEAKALTNLAQTRCWSGNVTTVSDSANRARELLDLVPNPVELVKLRSAEATAAAVAGNHVAAQTAIDETRRLADEIGYRGGHNLADISSIHLDCITDNRDRARTTLDDLDQRTRESGGNTYWVPIGACWIDGIEAGSARSADVQWLDGAAGTLERWEQVGRQ